MIAICWKAWTDIKEVTAVALNKGCLDVGLRKQHLGYHSSCDCWYFILLYGFLCCTLLILAGLLTVGGNLLPHPVTPLDVTTWHDAVDTPSSSTPCRMPASNTADITVTVDSECLHYLVTCRKE